MYKNFFYFDIETTSKYSSFFDYKLNDDRGAELFRKRYEKYKSFDKSWDKEINDAYIEKSPLLPEFGKIICISFGLFDKDVKKIFSIVDDDEKRLLIKFTQVIIKACKNRYLCGFNIKAFDIPYIIKKLYKYNIDIPICFNFLDRKPWEILVKDIYEIWKGTGNMTASLDEITYDLDINSPKMIMSGNDVHEYYWERKDIKSIMEYCENDVDATISIMEKLNF